MADNVTLHIINAGTLSGSYYLERDKAYELRDRLNAIAAEFHQPEIAHVTEDALRVHTDDTKLQGAVRRHAYRTGKTEVE